MNKQKWVGVLTALTTAFSMMSWAIPASAAEGTPISAPQNITESGTYTLTSNITDDGSTSGGAIYVAEGVEATLNLNGYSITGMDSDSDDEIDTNGISNAGTLTVSGDGTITGRNAIANENNNTTPTLSVSNCTLKGTIRQGIWNNGNLTVNGCTISSDSQNGINNSGGTVTVTDSQITGATNGIWTSSDVTVSDSTVSGSSRAVCTTGGTCTIKSGTYSATSDDPDDYTCAVLVAPYNEDVTLDINGGTYNTTGDYALYKENADYSETITIDDATLNGGLSDNESSSLNVTSINNTTIAASGKVVNLNSDMTSLTNSTITCSNMNLKTLANCSDTTVNGNLTLKNSANNSTISNLTATTLQVSTGKAAISGSNTNITTLSAYNTAAAITITEGTYGTLNGNGKYTISGGTFDTLSTAYFNITGGKFKSNPSVTLTTAKLTIPDDTAFELGSDGYYTLVSASGTGALTLDCGDGIKVIANKYANTQYDVGTQVTVEAFDTPFATFTGWYSSSDCTTLLSSDKEYTTTIAKGGTTLYAACAPTGFSYTAYDYNNTDTFEVDSEEDLFGISYLSLIGYDFSGKTVKLTGDIAMTQSFYPIAATPNASGDWKDVYYFGNSVFKGTFDGDGHTISNFICNEDYDLMTAGLIGHATNATVKNLRMNPKTVTGEYAAGLISWGICVTVSDCTVDGGDIGCPDGTGYAGGVFANASGCKIIDTTVNAIAIVNGSKTGAVVGNSYGLTLTNVAATDVAASSIVGCVYEDCTINMDNCTATSNDGTLSVVGQTVASSGKAKLNLTGDNTNLDISSMSASAYAGIDITVNAGTYTCDVKPYLADGLAADYEFDATSNAADTGDGKYVVISSTPAGTTEQDIVSKEVNDKYDHLKISTAKVQVDQGSKAVSFNVSCYPIGSSTAEWTQTVNGRIDGHGDINGNVLFNFIIKDIPAGYVLDITGASGVTSDSE